MKHIFRLLAFITSFCMFNHYAVAQNKKIILAVFAHPDDEGTVTPVLAKYAAAGASIYIVIATDGRYGASAHFGVDDPDSLKAIRTEEIKCVTSKLGINPPIQLGQHDQLRMQEGMDTMSLQLNFIKAEVTRLFGELKPDVVITWGPSGITGHPDHRLVGNIVTEVFSSKKWMKPSRLYYTELVSGSLPAGSMELATVDSSYLNVRIPVSREDVEKARSAWTCYKSQYTPESAKELQDLFWASQKGTAYFRSFEPTSTIQRTLFP